MPRAPATIALGAALATIGAATLPAAASASSSQTAIIQDDSDLYNPAGVLGQFRALGANTVRVFVPWSLVAPNRTSTKKPSFDATNPSAYPAANWAPYDNLVRQARLDGIAVDFTVAGAPRWAEGSGIPAVATTNPYYAWKPNAGEYGQFLQAIGKRYSGSFTPQGQSSPLPAVRFWSIFNEPNFGQDLGPQAIDGSRVSVAPMMYRSLVDAGFKALQSSGHGRDTILIGEYAARGIGPGRPTRNAPQGYPGNFSQTKPLQFIRTLYCVDSKYRELRAGAARAVGCPTSAAGSRSFRRQHPGLFNASGVADHPYPDNLSPVTDGRNDPDFAALPDLGRLAAALDRVNRVYGSHKRYPIYNTEYGYITHPPKSSHYPSPSTAAYYINWAEYLSFKNPRVASYMQYLLADPSPRTGAYNGFASGLETYNGTKKATYYAFRMPFYMPRTSFSRRQSVEVWGGARPAPFAQLDGNGAQQAQIQLQTGHSGFKTLKTVRLAGRTGYFDVRMKFPSSGTVRLQWTYPSQDSLLPSEDQGQTVYSRTFNIRVH
ncbi:MAG: hypothetical protein ACR2MK_08100 [Solirubrobacteraceae bacterium]